MNLQALPPPTGSEQQLSCPLCGQISSGIRVKGLFSLSTVFIWKTMAPCCAPRSSKCIKQHEVQFPICKQTLSSLLSVGSRVLLQAKWEIVTKQKDSSDATTHQVEVALLMQCRSSVFKGLISVLKLLSDIPV